MSYLFWIADVFRKGPFPLPGRGSKVSTPYCISLHFQEQPKPLQKKTSKLNYVDAFVRTRTPSDAGGMVEGVESPVYGAWTPPPRRSTDPPAELFSLLVAKPPEL